MAFSYKATLTVTSNSALLPSTQTDFTVIVHATNVSLKSVANGGQVTDANGHDICFFSDSGLSSLLNWDPFSFYWSASDGEIWAKVRIPSLALGTVFYAGIGNGSISTFQGGSQGAAYDSNHQGVYCFDAATLTGDDSSTNNNDGTLVNTPTAVAGKVGLGGASFVSASDQSINLGDPATLRFTSGSMTLCTWMQWRNGSSNAGILIGKDKDTGGRAYDLEMVGAILRFYINAAVGGGQIIGTTSFASTAGTWFRIVCVFSSGASDTSTLDLYVNAVPDNTQVTGAPTSIESATANVRIARREYSGFEGPWEGYMDDVSFHNTARSANWVTVDYNSQNDPATFVASSFEAIGTVTVLRGATRSNLIWR